MSGGSFNYLYCADYGDIGQRLEALSQMADELDEICPEAAAATRELADHVCSVEPKISALSNLWFEVEWWRSGDHGRDQVEAAVVKYRTAQAATQPQLSQAAQDALAATLRRCSSWHRVKVGQRWTGECLYDLLPCMLDKHEQDVPHRDPVGNTW